MSRPEKNNKFLKRVCIKKIEKEKRYLGKSYFLHMVRGIHLCIVMDLPKFEVTILFGIKIKKNEALKLVYLRYLKSVFQNADSFREIERNKATYSECEN